MEDLGQAVFRTKLAIQMAETLGSSEVSLLLNDARALAESAIRDCSAQHADHRMLSPSDLEAVTGLKRYSKQTEWFRQYFDVDVVRRDDGSPVVTWAIFEALNAKRYGTASHAIEPAERAVKLCFD